MRLDHSLNQLAASLTSIKEGLISALPSLLTAVAVLVVGWGLAWVLRRLVLGVLRGAGARISHRTTRQAWQETVDDQRGAQLASNGVYWLVLISAVVIALDTLDLPFLRRWMGVIAGALPRFVLATAVILGGVVAGRVAANAILKTAYRLPVAQVRSLSRLAYVSIVIASLVIAAGQLGLDVSLLTSVFLIVVAAALGGAALAFALGAREVMADILAMHYVSKSYRVGQVVRVGADEGRILRTTRTAVYLEAPEGELAIPGRDFAESRCMLLSEEVERGS
jgi:small-conductance mechanosensitive channel